MMLLCLYAGALKAQDGCRNRLRIAVLETHNFSPVHPAVLYIEELGKALETDEAGVVSVDSICNGAYTVHVHGAGYEDHIEKITVSGNASVRIRVAYSEHSLQEVVVREEQHQTVLQTKSNLTTGALRQNSGRVLAEMLQSISGVSVLGTGATISKPVIHGLHSNRIVMLNNGIRQEDQQWGGEHAPNIDPFLAGSVSVIKGAASVRYGTDAIAGVVLVEPQPLRNDAGWNGELNLAAFSNNRMGAGSLMLEHGVRSVPGLSFRLQSSFKKGGNYRVPGYWVANTGVQELNYAAALAYRKLHYGAEVFYSRFNTGLGIYRGSHTGNRQDLEAAVASPRPLVPADFSYEIGRPRQEVTHDLLKLKLYADNRLGVWNLIYGMQRNFRQEYDVLRVENGKAQLNLTLTTQTLNLNLDHRPIGRLKGQIGLDGMVQDNRFRTGDRVFIPTYQAYNAAVYLIERYRQDNWLLEGGVRLDLRNYDMTNYEGPNQEKVRYHLQYRNVSGTLGFRQELKSGWLWSLTLAQAWRAPQANELFSAGLHHGAARVELGNRGLKPERSFSLNAATEYKWHQRLNLELSVYSQLIDDFIYLEPGEDVLTIRGYFKTFSFRQTRAWLNGADLDLSWDWTDDLRTTAKASVLRARDQRQKDWLILMPADRLTIATRYTTSLGRRWQECFAELEGRFVARQTRIPSDFDSIDFPRPPGSYAVLGASVGARIMAGRQPVYLSLAATNLLNTRYRDYLDVFRYFLDQPGTNIVLRLRVPFEFKTLKNNNQKNDNNE